MLRFSPEELHVEFRDAQNSLRYGAGVRLLLLPPPGLIRESQQVGPCYGRLDLVMSLRRSAVACLLVLAFCAGPAAAACSDCCPKAEMKASLNAPVGCCGDCKPTIDRAADPASLTAKSVITTSDVQAVLSAPAEGLIRSKVISERGVEFAPRIVSPPAPPAALRL
jgi:hypothetical protein